MIELSYDYHRTLKVVDMAGSCGVHMVRVFSFYLDGVSSSSSVIFISHHHHQSFLSIIIIISHLLLQVGGAGALVAAALLGPRLGRSVFVSVSEMEKA